MAKKLLATKAEKIVMNALGKVCSERMRKYVTLQATYWRVLANKLEQREQLYRLMLTQQESHQAEYSAEIALREFSSTHGIAFNPLDLDRESAQ